MDGPVVLVTGSTSGIGKATAASLLTQGADVIIHGRDKNRCKAAQHDLTEKTGREPNLVIADLSDQQQVRSMAQEIASKFTHLNIIINNAGTYEKKHRLTPDGIEMTFAVNYIAPFLLTRQLLPNLKKNAPARIVNVASTAHEDIQEIDWDDLPALNRYDPWKAYALSKFGDVVFTYMLARELEGTDVTTTCLHPGVADTKILRKAFPGIPGISPEQGAQTSVYLALSKDVEKASGKFFENNKAVRSSPLTYDHAVQTRLWKIAEQVTGE